MPDSFIHKSVDKLLNSNTPLSQQVVIIPSERSKVYFEKELSLQLKKAYISPQFFTIDEFVQKLSPFIKLSNEKALFILYDIHYKLNEKSNKVTTFEEFLLWAPTLLKDFDEIDRFLINHNDLFKNLSDIKNIEQWSFSDENTLSDSQKKYLEFWNSIPSYYEEFIKRCKQIQSLLLGSIYKYVENNLYDLISKWENNTFYFFGLNALSNAELSIIKKLISLKRAHFWVDADLYYIEKEKHEAGFFIRKLINEFGNNILELCENNLKSKKLNVEIISCPQNTGQIKIASDIILNKKYKNSSDLLLLADEDLIGPVFQNIPSEIEKANITLGLPLLLTPIKSWIEQLILIQEGFIKHKKTSIYYKDLLNVWNHPFFQSILNKEEQKLVFETEYLINKNNKIFLSLNKIKISEKIDKLHSFIFSSWNNDWLLAINNIRKINSFLYELLLNSKELEKASIYKFDKQISILQSAFEENNVVMKLESFNYLLQSIWSNQNLSYFGNPTEGLQIMGLLETRMLQFDRICIVGFNEGKLPASLSLDSHIPMDLRHYFNLPGLREKEAVFAHHFYRLLQYCNELTVTYFKGIEGFSQAEKSRYLYQLELEFAKENNNITILNKDYSIDRTTEFKYKIEKDDYYFKELDNFCKKGISATKLKKYFTCPLDFYYQVILGFGEQENVEEELENSSFGSILHNVLESLYKDKLNKVLTKDDYEKMLEEYPELIKKYFLEHFDNDEESFMQGKNFLSYKITNELVNRFIVNEKDFILKNSKTITIEALEKKIKTTLTLKILGDEKEINLVGIIDRIDKIDSKIRIIDYKSGSLNKIKVQIKNSSIEQIINLCKKNNEYKYLLQLLTYIYLFHKNDNIIADECNLYPLLSTNYKVYTFEAENTDYYKLIEDYPNILQNLLEELYDKNKPIEHNSNSLYCKYCN